MRIKTRSSWFQYEIHGLLACIPLFYDFLLIRICVFSIQRSSLLKGIHIIVLTFIEG